MLLQAQPGQEGGKEGLDEDAEAEEGAKGDRFSRGGHAAPGWLHPGKDGFKLFQTFPKLKIYQKFSHLLTRLASSTLETAPTCSPACNNSCFCILLLHLSTLS